MTKPKYVLYEPGGRKVRGYSYGKLVEVRYFDVIRTDIESYSRQDFLERLRTTLDEFGADKLRECRVGYVDDNGVGDYYDALEFLANDGIMSPREAAPVAEPHL